MRHAPAAPPQARTLQTPAGTVDYLLTRKRVRNLNLRIRADGTVAVSAPARMPLREIEAFLTKKSSWIVTTRQRLLSRPPPAESQHTRQECLALFTAVSDSIFPLFAGILGGEKPTLKVREMTTRWGTCNVKKRVITLNTRLADKPMAAVEYVVLHEYVHFLHPDHQSGFHAEMARLMPDYKQRRRLLK